MLFELLKFSNMAARTARTVLQNGTRTIGIFRSISGPKSARAAIKSLPRTSSSLAVSPALSSLILQGSQKLGKYSSPSFLNNIRRIQDLTIDVNASISILSASDGNSQDTLLEQICTEDDDDQFRTNETLSKVRDEIGVPQHRGNIFAVVYIGGSQFKVTLNDVIMVNKLDAELGSRMQLEKVLLVGGENFTIVGRPLVSRKVVDVQATLIENTKTKKIIVFKKKRRKGYKKTQGHRQDLSALRINHIRVNSDSL